MPDEVKRRLSDILDIHHICKNEANAEDFGLFVRVTIGAVTMEVPVGSLTTRIADRQIVFNVNYDLLEDLDMEVM